MTDTDTRTTRPWITSPGGAPLTDNDVRALVRRGPGTTRAATWCAVCEQTCDSPHLAHVETIIGPLVVRVERSGSGFASEWRVVVDVADGASRIRISPTMAVAFAMALADAAALADDLANEHHRSLGAVA